MIFIDSEGDPIQEFSAIAVCDKTYEICDVLHLYVKFPSSCDSDKFARGHIHGLNIEFLDQYGLENQTDLLANVRAWLRKYDSFRLYAHAPYKEMEFLNAHVNDVQLRPWKERHLLKSHQIALTYKVKSVPLYSIQCKAHTSFKGWKPKKLSHMTLTDVAKCKFSHHCSLYDCFECMLFLLNDIKVV